MSGLDEILNIIETQQKQDEDRIISSAKTRAGEIQAEADEKAQKAHDDYMKKAKAQHERDFENACSSADVAAKRKILAEKVGMIDSVIENVVRKLKALPDDQYFGLMERLVKMHIRQGDGVIFFGKNDLKRIPADFENNINQLAEKAGGTVRISPDPADISDGFILKYGLVSENCGFYAMIEAEKDEVRDTAARALFGQVM